MTGISPGSQPFFDLREHLLFENLKFAEFSKDSDRRIDFVRARAGGGWGVNSRQACAPIVGTVLLFITETLLNFRLHI